MRSEKGAITLYVTVVCLFIILVGIATYVGVTNKQSAQLAVLGEIEQDYQPSTQTADELYQQFLGGDIVPVYTAEQFEKVGSGEQIYVEQTGKIYTFGTDKTYMFYGDAEDLTDTIKSELKTQLKQEIQVQIEKDGVKVTPTKAQEPEAPRLASNMVAVYWSKDGGATASVFEEGASPIYSKVDANGNPSSTGAKNPNFVEANWYEYVQGYNLMDTKTSRWANGVTDDGSYWVWIPRFKYKIVSKPGVTDTASAGVIDVKFISVEEKSGATVNDVTYTTYKNTDGEFITQDQNEYIVHPAFEDGSKYGAKAKGQTGYVEYNNGEWDSELAGFWVAKYEMSMEDGSGNALVPDSQTTGNVEIGSDIKMVSKANRSSWVHATPAYCYKNCYNYNRNNESHLIKMSEWGAIAYLTHSQYGRNGNEVTANLTNIISAYMGEVGSSTGNIYGVYDLSGGTWSYVAAWNTLDTSKYITNNGSVTIDGYAFSYTNGVSTKYATAYYNETEAYSGDVVKKVSKMGDAVKECHIANNLSWFKDFGESCCASYPFPIRGGRAASNLQCGVFASGIAEGWNGNGHYSSLVVLAE